MNKVVKYLILIIIPLAASFFLGLYGYNYYQGGVAAKEEYYSTAEETTSSQLQYFMQYNEYKFEETPVLSETIVRDGKTLVKFEIYRASYTGTKVNDDDEEVDWEYARYIFVAYDVDYVAIKNLFGLSATDKNEATTPTLRLVITPNDLETYDEEEDAVTITLTNTSRSIDGYFGIVDYNATPKKTDQDPFVSSSYTGAVYTRWNVEAAFDAEYGNEFTMDLEAITTLRSDTRSEKLLDIDYDFDLTYEEFENTNFTEGYDGDEIKAGYFSWVFRHRLWWICLIALVIVGFLTYMFVAIWETDSTTSKNQPAKTHKK